MQMIAAWVLFPLVLVALGAGWGVLVEKAWGRELQGALLVPVGLMAALLAAAMMTASKATAPAAAAVVGAAAVAGLAVAWPGGRISRWPLLAAIGALLAYGASIILSGQATFAGYGVLDDTATWLGITDQLFSHGRAVIAPPSTYSLAINDYVHAGGYPTGGFMLLGVGRGLTGIDAAWVFQPYLASCGALVALAAYQLFERFMTSRPLRAGLAFIAAQPALLYGYSLWGGIKELTVAWILMAGIALIEPYIGRSAPEPREAVVLALPAAALVSTLGAGAAIWLALPFAALAASWGWAAWRARDARMPVTSSATLVAGTALLALPALLVFSTFTSTDSVIYAQPTGRPNDLDALGRLFKPLSPFQLAGIWPTGDFRYLAPTGPTTILVALVIASAIATIVISVRRRQAAIALYVAIAVLSTLAVKLSGGSPWVIAKALAMGSPALLAAALIGGALLLQRSRPAGILVCALLAGGVLWSNALAAHDVRLAPRPRLAELQHVGNMIAGKSPTLFTEFESYATSHFLRAGVPISPNNTGPGVKLLGGQELGSAGYADLDSYPLQTVLVFRTIVTGRSPTQSRPPSAYRLVWQGRWYQVWQRPATPAELPLVPQAHIPGGDSNKLPYCGISNKGTGPRCSIAPASVPPCSDVQRIGAVAAREHDKLVAFQRGEPLVARAIQASGIPPSWTVDESVGGIIPTTPGTTRVGFDIKIAQRYGLWIGGMFPRGVEIAVDGHSIGHLTDPKQTLVTYAHVRTLTLGRGGHTVALTFTRDDLGPNHEANRRQTALMAVALDPLDSTKARMLDVAPSDAKSLCGRSLDWIELAKPRA